MRTAELERLLEARRAKRPVVLARALAGDPRSLVIGSPDFDAPAALADGARRALRTDAALEVEVDDSRWLLTPYNPPLRLVVVGAVHIAEALCRFALALGHDVTLIDPRTAFLRPALFPGVRLSGEWPQDVLPTLDLDARCAAVLLTHDPKVDDPALEVLLASPVYYIGALGSRRTHARRLERLAARGFDAPALARIRGPAGLAIGARTPEEIALSILAELTAALRLPGGDRSDAAVGTLPQDGPTATADR